MQPPVSPCIKVHNFDTIFAYLQEGSLETLGKILLQDSFVVSDTKNRRKGKERHVFLFEQALLFSKEQKDSYGKVRYLFKNKLKVFSKLDIFSGALDELLFLLKI